MILANEMIQDNVIASDLGISMENLEQTGQVNKYEANHLNSSTITFDFVAHMYMIRSSLFGNTRVNQQKDMAGDIENID